MKDVVGNELNIGDVIVYSNALHYMKIGKITKVEEERIRINDNFWATKEEVVKPKE